VGTLGAPPRTRVRKRQHIDGTCARCLGAFLRTPARSRDALTANKGRTHSSGIAGMHGWHGSWCTPWLGCAVKCWALRRGLLIHTRRRWRTSCVARGFSVRRERERAITRAVRVRHASKPLLVPPHKTSPKPKGTTKHYCAVCVYMVRNPIPRLCCRLCYGVSELRHAPVVTNSL